MRCLSDMRITKSKSVLLDGHIHYRMDLDVRSMNSHFALDCFILDSGVSRGEKTRKQKGILEIERKSDHWLVLKETLGAPPPDNRSATRYFHGLSRWKS